MLEFCQIIIVCIEIQVKIFAFEQVKIRYLINISFKSYVVSELTKPFSPYNDIFETQINL